MLLLLAALAKTFPVERNRAEKGNPGAPRVLVLPWNCTVDFQLTGLGSGAQGIDGDRQHEKQKQKYGESKWFCVWARRGFQIMYHLGQMQNTVGFRAG